MSASSKKKLRAEASAAKLTERQQAEQKEAKKIKLYTTAFAVVMAAIVVVAIVAGVSNTITGSGMRERNTTALTVGSHTLSNAELNYFYVDAVNNFYSQNGAYVAFYGLDVTQPLDQQVIDPETGITWADNFMQSAESNARATYALADDAAANGFTLDAMQQEQVDVLETNLQTYAAMSGATDADTYLKAYYGNGARVDTFKEYYRLGLLANAYEAHKRESLTYSDAEIQAKYNENPSAYTSYTFNQYYLAASKFLTGGTAAEDGTTVYSDEENAAAVKAAEAAAKSLVADEITDVAALDAAIAALDVNAGTSAKSSAYVNQRTSSMSTVVSDWITGSTHKAGDKACLANTTVAEDGSETINGYYVVLFQSEFDNQIPMVNVRHILVSFENGTTEDGVTTYSDAQKMLAQASAESILNEWKAGEATEDSFAALAAEKSTDTGSNANGGLYENVYPGQMVTAFNDWCFDSSRKSGDTGIVETEYGYHVMYFVGNSEMTYRDYLITSDLRSSDMNDWYNTLIEAMPMTENNTSYVNKALIINANG